MKNKLVEPVMQFVKKKKKYNNSILTKKKKKRVIYKFFSHFISTQSTIKGPIYIVYYVNLCL